MKLSKTMNNKIKFLFFFSILLISAIFIPQKSLAIENLFNVDINTVALWRFNEISGNLVADETGINNGTAIGANIVDGKFGKARYFNGNSDYIRVPDSPSLNNFSQITIEAWVYPQGFDLGQWNQDEGLIVKGDATDFYSSNAYGIWITRNSDFSQIRFGTQFGSIGVSSGWYSSNQWYYVAANYNGNDIKLYINSVSEGLSNGLSPVVSNSRDLYMNHHTWDGGGASSQRMQGIIDEIRISNIARSAQEISNYYNQAVPPPNQPPTISNFNQFKSDSQTSINEISITTENTVVFKATLNDPDNDQVKFQIELKEYNQLFDGQNLLESNFVSSTSEAIITRMGLVDGQYKWRARAIDDKGNASQWQEFGVVGNMDFEVKLVPLYTQGISNYPSLQLTDSWDDNTYAKGLTEKYSCGSTIATCGCALTSAVMVARYYDVKQAQGNDVNPKEVNSWLQSQPTGYQNGSINWVAIARYANSRIKYDIGKSGNYLNNYALLDEKLNNNQPVIAREKKGRGGINREHFIVIDNKLATTYGVKDPAWYNTKTLNDATNSVGKVRGYENGFDGLRIYKKGDGIAQSSMTIALGSPAELLIIDSQGRKLGKDSSGMSYKEIPDATYFEEGYDDPTEENPPSDHKNKIIQILEPVGGAYQLQVIGTGMGSYGLWSSSYDTAGNPQGQEFHSETAPGYIATYNINFDSMNSTNTGTKLFDEVPPEAKIFFSTTTQQLTIQGIDNTTVNPAVSFTQQGKKTIYQIKDEAGNTTKLTFSKLKQEGKEIKAELKFIQYNSESVIGLPKTELKYEWSLDKNTGEIKELEQKVEVKDMFEIKAKYSREKNETEMKVKKNGENETKQTLPGLVIIKLVAKVGVLGFEY
mgnify:CR=1 FL=1